MKVEFARPYQKKIPYIQHLTIQTAELGEGSARLSQVPGAGAPPVSGRA
jgi:hypothetical protein